MTKICFVILFFITFINVGFATFAFNDERTRFMDAYFDSEHGGLGIHKGYVENFRHEANQQTIVAVIDSGLYKTNHPELEGQLWINTKEIPDNQIDDDNNGIVDDVFGADFLNRDELNRPTGRPMGESRNGLMVAGLIGAIQNNMVNIPGVASNIKLMTLKIMEKGYHDEESNVYFKVSHLMEAFTYAADHGAKIISFGYSKSDLNETEIRELKSLVDKIAAEKNVLFIFGVPEGPINLDQNPSWPASIRHTHALTVGVMDEWQKPDKAFGKNTVDVFSSSDITTTTFSHMNAGSQFINVGGGSVPISTGLVAGAFAELLTRYPGFNLSFHLKKERLKEIVYSRPLMKDLSTSGGSLDFYKLKRVAENDYVKRNLTYKKTLLVKVKASLDFLKHYSFYHFHVHLFNNYYRIWVDDIETAKVVLKRHSDVLGVYEDHHGQEHSLGDEMILPPISSSMKSIQHFAFNDPYMRRIQAFFDVIHNGMGVHRAYVTPFKIEDEQKIIVAVLDTGVDYNHEDLTGNMWVNEDEIAGNGIDDDDNGFIDDIHGIDLLNRNRAGTVSGDAMASHTHGTHVAGIIAGVQNNFKGIAGIASNAKIMSVRLVPDKGDEIDGDIIQGMLYAAQNGAKIINCSFSKLVSELNPVLIETIKFIHEKYQVLFVFSAGNVGNNIDFATTSPGSINLPFVLTVGGLDEWGNYLGNFGPKTVDIAASWAIISTLRDNKYGSMQGTSMAAPAVSGALAEIMSRYPNLTPIQVWNILMETAYKRDSMVLKVSSQGSLNLYEAFVKAEAVNYQ